MPRFDVPDPKDQEALFETRYLVSPGWVQQQHGIKRQTVETSGKYAGSRFLLWAFATPRTRLRNVHEVYVDAGRRPGAEDIFQWQGNDPAELLEEARRRYAELLRDEGEIAEAVAAKFSRIGQGGS